MLVWIQGSASGDIFGVEAGLRGGFVGGDGGDC